MIYNPWVTDPDWEIKDQKLQQLKSAPVCLSHFDGILEKIPYAEGIFGILGPRQVGKSTLLRMLVKRVLKKVKPSEVILVEGDAMESWRELFHAVEDFSNRAPSIGGEFHAAVLIDEITSIDQWYRAIKLLADHGNLNGILLVYTGSSSISLKEGGELLPGRRGRHKQTDFELFPASFRQVEKFISLEEYFTVGGFPWAVNEYLRLGVLPEYVGEIYWSWIKGEFIKRGKSEMLLKHVVEILSKRTETGFSQHTLAREMGIASNETARQYLELLVHCFAIHEIFWFDPQKNLFSPRKNKKYYPIDPLLIHLFRRGGSLLGVDPKTPIPPEFAGKIAELIVCNELKRMHQKLGYWADKREIDFVPCFIEVKYQSRVHPQEFSWFLKQFPGKRLLLLTKNDDFHLGQIRAIPLKNWLLMEDGEKEKDLS